jgi:hypothetical protein
VRFEVVISAGAIQGFGVYSVSRYTISGSERLTVMTGSGKGPLAAAAAGAGARRLREALRQLPEYSVGRWRGAGAGAGLKLLGRRASGALIAVPESALARGGATLTEAVPKVAAFGAFLEQRLPGAAIEYVAPAPGRPVTRAAVCDAVAAARSAAGDLFVVLFFGHGVPASDRRLDRRWALTTEELGGADLSRHLGALPASVDTVVISVCCYGRDVRGAARPPGGDVGSGGPVEGPPAVWISASGNGRSGGGVVLRAVAARLPDEVRDAAERGASYRGLGGRVQRAAVRGARVPRRRMAARSAWTGSSSGCSAVH